METIEDLVGKTFKVYECKGCHNFFVNGEDLAKHLAHCVKYQETSTAAVNSSTSSSGTSHKSRTTKSQKESAPRALRSRKYEFKPVAELKDGKRAQQPPQDTPSTTSTPSTPCTAQRKRKKLDTLSGPTSAGPTEHQSEDPNLSLLISIPLTNCRSFNSSGLKSSMTCNKVPPPPSTLSKDHRVPNQKQPAFTSLNSKEKETSETPNMAIDSPSYDVTNPHHAPPYPSPDILVPETPECPSRTSSTARVNPSDRDKLMTSLHTGDYMCRFLASKEFSDAVILTDLAEIPVHKLVIAAKYPHLSQHLSNVEVIDFSAISYGHVSAWLKYLYTNDETAFSRISLESLKKIAAFIQNPTRDISCTVKSSGQSSLVSSSAPEKGVVTSTPLPGCRPGLQEQDGSKQEVMSSTQSPENQQAVISSAGTCRQLSAKYKVNSCTLSAAERCTSPGGGRTDSSHTSNFVSMSSHNLSSTPLTAPLKPNEMSTSTPLTAPLKPNEMSTSTPLTAPLKAKKMSASTPCTAETGKRGRPRIYARMSVGPLNKSSRASSQVKDGKKHVEKNLKVPPLAQPSRLLRNSRKKKVSEERKEPDLNISCIPVDQQAGTEAMQTSGSPSLQQMVNGLTRELRISLVRQTPEQLVSTHSAELRRSQLKKRVTHKTRLDVRETSGNSRKSAENSVLSSAGGKKKRSSSAALHKQFRVNFSSLKVTPQEDSNHVHSAPSLVGTSTPSAGSNHLDDSSARGSVSVHLEDICMAPCANVTLDNSLISSSVRDIEISPAAVRERDMTNKVIANACVDFANDAFSEIETVEPFSSLSHDHLGVDIGSCAAGPVNSCDNKETAMANEHTSYNAEFMDLTDTLSLTHSPEGNRDRIINTSSLAKCDTARQTGQRNIDTARQLGQGKLDTVRQTGQGKLDTVRQAAQRESQQNAEDKTAEDDSGRGDIPVFPLTGSARTPIRPRGTHRAYVPSPYTPMDHFNSFSDEQLKARLRAYGLRDKMSRKRMISTLTELYAQTHQYETDTSAEWTIVNTPCRDLSPPPASWLDSAATPRLESVESSEVGAVLSIPDSNNEPVTSQTVSESNPLPVSDIDQLLQELDGLVDSSAGSAVDVNEMETGNQVDDADDDVTLHIYSGSESGSDENDADAADEVISSAAESSGVVLRTPADLNDALRQLIRGHDDLYARVLTYQMIPREELTTLVRSAGIRCSHQQLDSFCSKQCICVQSKPRPPRKHGKKKAGAPGKTTSQQRN